MRAVARGVRAAVGRDERDAGERRIRLRELRDAVVDLAGAIVGDAREQPVEVERVGGVVRAGSGSGHAPSLPAPAAAVPSGPRPRTLP